MTQDSVTCLLHFILIIEKQCSVCFADAILLVKYLDLFIDVPTVDVICFSPGSVLSCGRNELLSLLHNHVPEEQIYPIILLFFLYTSTCTIV